VFPPEAKDRSQMTEVREQMTEARWQMTDDRIQTPDDRSQMTDIFEVGSWTRRRPTAQDCAVAKDAEVGKEN